MSDRWSAERVHALASDASSLRAAQAIATPGRWTDTGAAEDGLWGRYRGSSATPYQTCVDLVEPAYHCSCPSRKAPCKHALALLLLSAGGSVPPGDPPQWFHEWEAARSARAARATRPRSDRPADEEAARKRAAQRTDRVAAGLTELERWLDDQIRQGIAGLDRAGYGHWDRMAARLVDAQAPALAGRVRGLAGVASSGAGWEERLLSELALIRLLISAYRRLDQLPAPLAATVRTRIGFTVGTEQVLAGEPVRDDWQVLARRDEADDWLVTRRVWLRGRGTGRPALVLSFIPIGQPLPADLLVGTAVDADLCFYPGAAEPRALVANRYAAATTCTDPTPAVSVAAALDEYADAVAADPWVTSWPVLLRAALVPGRPWRVVDAAGDALPLYPPTTEAWNALAASGGHLATFAGELGPEGFRPLTAYAAGEVALA